MNNFFDFIYKSLLANRNKELIVWVAQQKEVVYTGEDLLAEIGSFRTAIEKSKTTPGQKIIPAIPVSCQTLCALLAIQSLGMIAVSPPPKLNFLSFILFLKREKISAVIFKKQTATIGLLLRLMGIKTIIKTNPQKYDWKTTEVTPDATALISYTSGSTGKPKAIYRNHKVLSAQHQAIKNAFPPFADQVDYPLFPNVLLHNLIVGVKSVLPNIANLKVENVNPELIVRQIKEAGVNSMTGNVFYFTKLLEFLDANPQHLPNVKAIGIGGSPVHDNLILRLKPYFNNADFFIIYGSSEAEPIAIRKVDDTLTNPMNGFFVGKPVAEITIRIIETDTIETPNGTYKTGEIEVKGEHVVVKNNSWLKTGDFGYLTEENDLYLTARKANDYSYLKIQHYQIENLLLQQAGVKKVAAIYSGNGFHIFMDGSFEEDAINQIIKNQLPINSVHSIISNAKIPVDLRHHSKILYTKLKNEIGI